MKKLCTVALVALLGACSTTPSATVGTTPAPAGVASLVSKVQALTVSDAALAQADALANGDTIAAPCYPALATWATSSTIGNGLAPLPAGSGAMLVHQRIRDLAKQPGFTIPPAVKLACAALLIDDEVFIVKLDTFLAGAVASGGATAVSGLTGLPLVPLTLTPAGVQLAPVPVP